MTKEITKKTAQRCAEQFFGKTVPIEFNSRFSLWEATMGYVTLEIFGVYGDNTWFDYPHGEVRVCGIYTNQAIVFKGDNVETVPEDEIE
mgnify:CR=1 FL=1